MKRSAQYVLQITLNAVFSLNWDHFEKVHRLKAPTDREMEGRQIVIHE